jgi:phosphatidylglycerol lysyltransferase
MTSDGFESLLALCDDVPGPGREDMQSRWVSGRFPIDGGLGFVSRAGLARCHGETGLAPFLNSPDAEIVELLDGLGAGAFVRRRRWAISAGDVVAPSPMRDLARSEYLEVLARLRLVPAFMAISDPVPYSSRGFAVSEIADEAIVDLESFSLLGSARASLRHSCSAALRAGLTVEPYLRWMDGQLAEISREWLRTKRGGELGFTLSRHRDVADQLADGSAEIWVVVDSRRRVQAWCTWRSYRNGQARVLDVMRRRPAGPNPSMDYLISSCLEYYRDVGVVQASLASVPRDHGPLADRIYPSRSLRAYKEKFVPRWEPRWLAVPRRVQRPGALVAICGAYCPGGLGRAFSRNV